MAAVQLEEILTRLLVPDNEVIKQVRMTSLTDEGKHTFF